MLSLLKLVAKYQLDYVVSFTDACIGVNSWFCSISRTTRAMSCGIRSCGCFHLFCFSIQHFLQSCSAPGIAFPVEQSSMLMRRNSLVLCSLGKVEQQVNPTSLFFQDAGFLISTLFEYFIVTGGVKRLTSLNVKREWPHDMQSNGSTATGRV